MNKKLLFIFSLACIFFFSSINVASASPGLEHDDVYTGDMAVYLNHDFYGDSAIVSGSIYSGNGNIKFSNSGSNDVTGNIYHKTGNQFIIPEWYHPSFADRVISLDDAGFDGYYPELIDAPLITNYVGSLIPAWGSAPVTIAEDTHFGTLVVRAPLVVDVSQKDIYLVVDNLTFEWNQSITLQGNGRLFLFINNYNRSGGPISINNGSNPDKTYIFSESSISNDGLNLYAHVYYNSISALRLEGKITGSVMTNATSLTIDGGGDIVNGLVYAPHAAATVKSPNNNPNITGRIVADSLNLVGSGRIVYNPAYTLFYQNIIPQIEKQEVRVRANMPEAGTVTPTDIMANYGEVIKITATPNEGYRFVGFSPSVSSMIPDANGNLKVTGPVNLIANFELVGEYTNGLLGEYYDSSELDNYSALKMKRIDSNLAFNFGYDSPDPVIEPETFSIRWSGFIKPTVTGSYTFKTYSDDGIRVTVNNSSIIDSWGELSLAFTTANIPVLLEAGQYYPITVEYQQLPLYAAAFLFWEANGVPMSIVPESSFFVAQETYDNYTPVKYYNQLGKTGTGLNNTFYTLNSNGTRTQEYSEVDNINYVWDDGAPGAIDEDVFYGEMEGYLEAKYTENTTLVFSVDDGIRVWIGDENGNWVNNGNPVISEWDWHSVEDFEYSFQTIAGHKYKIRIEYVDFGLGATCIMGWKGAALGSGIIPIEYLYTE